MTWAETVDVRAVMDANNRMPARDGSSLLGIPLHLYAALLDHHGLPLFDGQAAVIASYLSTGATNVQLAELLAIPLETVDARLTAAGLVPREVPTAVRIDVEALLTDPALELSRNWQRQDVTTADLRVLRRCATVCEVVLPLTKAEITVDRERAAVGALILGCGLTRSQISATIGVRTTFLELVLEDAGVRRADDEGHVMDLVDAVSASPTRWLNSTAQAADAPKQRVGDVLRWFRRTRSTEPLPGAIFDLRDEDDLTRLLGPLTGLTPRPSGVLPYDDASFAERRLEVLTTFIDACDLAPQRPWDRCRSCGARTVTPDGTCLRCTPGPAAHASVRCSMCDRLGPWRSTGIPFCSALCKAVFAAAGDAFEENAHQVIVSPTAPDPERDSAGDLALTVVRESRWPLADDLRPAESATPAGGSAISALMAALDDTAGPAMGSTLSSASQLAEEEVRAIAAHLADPFGHAVPYRHRERSTPELRVLLAANVGEVRYREMTGDD